MLQPSLASAAPNMVSLHEDEAHVNAARPEVDWTQWTGAGGDWPKHVGQDVLRQARDPTAPFFFSSSVGKFEDAWQPFLGGLFRAAPMPVYYKASFQSGDVLLAVLGHSAPGAPFLPPAVRSSLQALGITMFDWAWVITDVSSVLPQYGPCLNLSHHAWHFPEDVIMEVMGGRRVEVPLLTGAFTYRGSRVGPAEPGRADLAMQRLDEVPMTIHPQRGRGGHMTGALCCSPNNAKFCLMPSDDGGRPLAHLWTVAVTGKGGEVRAVVTLQWIIYGHIHGMDSLKGCGNVGEAVEVLQKVLGEREPAVVAVCGMLGCDGHDDGRRAYTDGYGGETETQPMRSERREGGGERGGRGRGRRGRGRGGMDGSGRSRGGYNGRWRGSGDSEYRGGGGGGGRGRAMQQDWDVPSVGAYGEGPYGAQWQPQPYRSAAVANTSGAEGGKQKW